VGFGKSNHFETGIEEMRLYRQRCEMGEGLALSELGIDLRQERPIYVGRFIDRDAPPFQPIRLEAV
jgi:hypothetical protein